MSNSVQATVLFTDIVGYSKMMDRDEKNAVQLLAEHDKIIESAITRNGGEVIKHIGDAIFARFETPLSAIASALEFQKKLQTVWDQIRDHVLTNFLCKVYKNVTGRDYRVSGLWMTIK